MAGTIFRFALQTGAKRASETWSFFCNRGKGDLYAVRTSWRGWQKISFHESGRAHLKAVSGPERREKVQFHWDADLTNPASSHLFRVVYEFGKLGAHFPLDRKVHVGFDELLHGGCVHLDTYLTDDPDIWSSTDEQVSVCKHELISGRWAVFTLSPAPAPKGLPEPTQGMTFHLGHPFKDGQGQVTHLENSTAVFYSVPNQAGPLTIVEVSWRRFVLRDAQSDME